MTTLLHQDSISREHWKLSYSFVVFVIGFFFFTLLAPPRFNEHCGARVLTASPKPANNFLIFLAMTTKESTTKRPTEESTELTLLGCGELYRFGDWRAWIETLFIYIYSSYSSRLFLFFSLFFYYNEQYLSYDVMCVENWIFFSFST